MNLFLARRMRRAGWLSLLLCLSALGGAAGQSGTLTLPVYSLTLDSLDLQYLYDHPFTDLYFPATFSYGALQYDCGVRFRGGTSRDLPKKSWRIAFDDDDNIFQAEKLNLNAEYRDISLMRNFLTLRLFEHLGYPAAQVQFISLMVNGRYLGVFVQVEEPDEYFLARRNRPPAPLYKAFNGGNMGPFLNYDDYFRAWDKKIGNALDYRDIQTLLQQLLYLPKAEFETLAPGMFDLDNALNYFAAVYAVANLDGFLKNYYLYHHPASGRYEIFPWDNDASFGNDWKGDYIAERATYLAGIHTYHQVLMQRLLENSQWRAGFRARVDSITHGGFEFIESVIDSTYLQIKNDVYQDTFKIAGNPQFDAEMDRLKSFMQLRRAYLEPLNFFERLPLSGFYCSNPFPGGGSSQITFRAQSPAAQPVYLDYTLNLQHGVYGAPYTVNSLPLYDDGLHDDLQANDLVYGNTLTLPAGYNGVVPYAYRGGEFSYPVMGLFYLNYHPTITLAMSANPAGPGAYQQLVIGPVYRAGADYFVAVSAPVPGVLDLSYCHLGKPAAAHQKFILPYDTKITAADTLIITSNRSLASLLFPQHRIAGNFWFDIQAGDTLALLAPSWETIVSTVCGAIIDLNLPQLNLVINEINYHSHPDFDTEDWVEFYNPYPFELSLGGWHFRDEDNSHLFTFPENARITANGYLVVCRDLSIFRSFFPGVSNSLGNFDFGLSGAGEMIRLYDPAGRLCDSLRYDDNSPWPSGPDGNGPTLALKNPGWDNALPQSWAASLDTGGTPGAVNDVLVAIPPTSAPAEDGFTIARNYPNPFNAATRIDFRVSRPGAVEILILNIRGQRVAKYRKAAPHPGSYSLTWQAANLSSGIYFYQIRQNGLILATRKAVLIK